MKSLDALHRIHGRGYANMDFDAFEIELSDWQIIERNGAYILRKGPEFHVESFNDGKWCSRKLLRDTLGEAIERYGYAETRVRRHHQPGHALAIRLGFRPVREDGDVIWYRLYESPHLKRK